MYGGGVAYNASASQFAGGGFMPSQEDPQNRGAAGSAQKGKGYDSKDSTLRSLTVKQIFEAAQSPDDQMVLDGKPVVNITIVGKIVGVEEQQLMTLYTIDDGTGRLFAKYWTPDNDDDFDRQRRAEWRVGVYVRVHGHLSSMGKEKSMVAFNMRLITDFNEVTYHFLQCVFQHLHLVKGGGMGAGGAGGGFGVKPEPVAYSGAAAGGAGMSAAAAAPAVGGYNPNASMTPAADAVLKMMQQMQGGGDQGVNVPQLASHLGNQLTMAQVRGAIEFLSNEGHIYSTIDDQHYRTCT